MSKHFVFTFLLLLLMKTIAFGQETFIESNSLTITCNKTTHLIFPYAIRSIDRGSQDVLAQKAPGSDNVLQLKAAKAGFTETNITVITSDNKLYSFKVNYSLLPQHLTISFVNAENLKDGTYYSVNSEINSKQSDVALLEHTIQQVAGEKKRMYAIYDQHGWIQLQLKGLYIKNDVFYFQFQVSNLSNIRFDIQNIFFTVKNSGKAKRKATQENILQPVLTNSIDSSIQSHFKRVWVVAIPKFTLEDGKYLAIQVFEENGGRNLAIKVLNRHLLAAKAL